MPQAELKRCRCIRCCIHAPLPHELECGRLLSPEVLTAKSNHALLLYALGKRTESAALYSDVLQQAVPRLKLPELRRDLDLDHERQPCTPKERVFGAYSSQVGWPWRYLNSVQLLFASRAHCHIETGTQQGFEGNRFRICSGIFDESQVLSKQ